MQRFEKTNEMLLNCNALSAGRLKVAGEEFKRHTKLLNEMKKDLDYIFKKIRTIRTKISHQYPDAFAEAQPQRCSFAEECEDDEDVAAKSATTTTTAAAGTSSTAATSTTTSTIKSPELKKNKKLDKVNSKSNNIETSVNYVQMKQSPDNGQSSGEMDKRQSLGSAKSSSTDNSNDSSDGTSDTV